MASSTSLLLIFTRNPELGKVKTRLAASIGDQSALEVYQFLLEKTVAFTQDLPLDKHVYYSETISANDIWDATIYKKYKQEGPTLGDRMANAFRTGFAQNYDKICIIGSDMYDLDAATIEDAFAQLQSHDMVIGPADDGGYYLLGMKTLHPDIFSNKEWGTETVLSQTLADIQHLNVHLLDTRNDIDRIEDIKGIAEFEKYLKS